MSTFKFTRQPNPKLNEAREWAAELAHTRNWSELKLSTGTRADVAPRQIDRAVVVFEEKRSFLSALLQLDGEYTAGDGDKIVGELIDQLKFYSKYRHPALPTDESCDNDDCSVTIRQGPEYLSFLGPVLGPGLSIGCRRVTFSTDVPFGRNSPTYFIAAIAGILSNISADVSFKTESFEELRGWNNAMIILDSADLTAATRSAVENVWSCRGRTFWTPNYIYIEESAFDQFVQLLEADAVNYVDALGIPIVNMNEREASSAEQKVIQPTDCQHFRFFVGLHPCRTEPAVGEGAILLPFRSLEEVFGSLPDCLSTSVWTEKMCGQVTSRLKVKTIWFNCHGIMEPETLPSFDSFPVGLSRLERMLLVRQEKYWTSFADEPLRLSVNLTELKSPALLVLNERFFLLEPVRREMSKKLRFSVPLADSALRTTDSGLELMTYVVNRGPLVVNSPSIIPPDDLLTIVHYAVLNGSPVVVNSPSNISSESLIGLESKGYLLRVSHDLPVVLECPASYLVYFKEEESTEIPLVRWNQIGLSSRKVDCLHDCQHLLGYRMSVIYR